MKINKIKKDGTPSRQGDGGGFGDKTKVGNRAPIEKIELALKKKSWEEFKVMLAEESWGEMTALIHDPVADIRLRAITLAWAYAYGKPKEAVDVTSQGQRIFALPSELIEKNGLNTGPINHSAGQT